MLACRLLGLAAQIVDLVDAIERGLDDPGVLAGFDLLRPWLRSCHINELPGGYPYKELFRLMKASGYDRWTLCEATESKEPERFLTYYRALWRELMA